MVLWPVGALDYLEVPGPLIPSLPPSALFMRQIGDLGFEER